MTDEQLYELLLKAEDEETEARTNLDKFLTRGVTPNNPDQFQAASDNWEKKRQATWAAFKAFMDQHWGEKSKLAKKQA